MSQNSTALIQLENLHKKFTKRPDIVERLFHSLSTGRSEETVHAVNGVSLTIQPGEVVGLVGESGCGKSTLGRMVAGLLPATEGAVLYKGQDVRDLKAKERLKYILDVQLIFQDPLASLNPKQKLGSIISEALYVHKLLPKEHIPERIDQALLEVGLDPEYKHRLPHQISGGQRQRIGIARALAVNPSFLVCDEPVAALDVSIQAQVINLFMDLRDRHQLTYLFISHDLGVVRHISDRVAIMYLGKIVELASRDDIFSHAAHPYTQALLAEMPSIHKQKRSFEPLKGEIPSPLNPPSGCAFHPRCPVAKEICKKEAPTLKHIHAQHQAACHLLD